VRLYLAGAMQHVGVGPRRIVRRQPVLCGPESVAGTTRPQEAPRVLRRAQEVANQGDLVFVRSTVRQPTAFSELVSS
jgi:hypothetical protein